MVVGRKPYWYFALGRKASRHPRSHLRTVRNQRNVRYCQFVHITRASGSIPSHRRLLSRLYLDCTAFPRAPRGGGCDVSEFASHSLGPVNSETAPGWRIVTVTSVRGKVYIRPLVGVSLSTPPSLGRVWTQCGAMANESIVSGIPDPGNQHSQRDWFSWLPNTRFGPPPTEK